MPLRREPASSERVALPHAEGHYLRVRRFGADGTDISLLLIHGFGTGSFIWDHLIPPLSYHGGVAAIDLRGHGDSSRDPTGVYATQTHVADIAAVLEVLCTRPIALIGHALGAEIAIHLAATLPQRTLGVVLVDGGVGMNQQELRRLSADFASQPWWYETPESYARHLGRTYPLADPALLRSFSHSALVKETTGGFRLRCDSALRHWSGGTDDELLWSLFKSVRTPVLVIRGSGSTILTRDSARRMTQENARCVVRTVQHAGHAVMLDSPEEFLMCVHRYTFELGLGGPGSIM